MKSRLANAGIGNPSIVCPGAEALRAYAVDITKSKQTLMYFGLSADVSRRYIGAFNTSESWHAMKKENWSFLTGWPAIGIMD